NIFLEDSRSTELPQFLGIKAEPQCMRLPCWPSSSTFNWLLNFFKYLLATIIMLLRAIQSNVPTENTESNIPVEVFSLM
ncbi:hypothetical protein V4Y02_23840, partial [Escherichia coli]